MTDRRGRPPGGAAGRGEAGEDGEAGEGAGDAPRPAKPRLEVAVPVRLEVPEDLNRRLELRAEAEGVPVQDVMLDAMDAMLARYGRPPLPRARPPFDTGQRPRGRAKRR